MAGWSSLPPDLLRRVGDCLVATNDIDSYMDMRAVCPNWRAAIAAPASLGAGAVDDLPFRPRQWVMLGEPKHEDHDDDSDDDDFRIFVHVSTGRVLRRRLPWLGQHVLVGASDGLLVLADKEAPHAARLLNPFTGSMLAFAAPVPVAGELIVAVTADPTVLVLFNPRAFRGGCDVLCAGPTSQLFEVTHLSYDRDPFYIESMVSHAGRVHLVDNEGWIICSKSDGTLQFNGRDYDKPCYMPGDLFLVDSAGELLLVRRARGAIEVFKVDLHLRVLERVTSIGNRAIFLGKRCLSVNADKLSSVDGNCIYYSTHELRFQYTTCMITGKTTTNYDVPPPRFPIRRYDLNKGREEKVSGLLMPDDACYAVRPFSLLQLIATYCQVVPDVYAQLRRIHLPPVPGTRRVIFGVP